MSFVKGSVLACNPATTRGASTKLSSSKDGKVVYTNGRTVIIRDIKNPTLSLAYSGHVPQTTVARISPSGFYCASADVQGNVRIWDTSYLTKDFPPSSIEPPVTKYEYKPISGKISDLAWDGESKRIIVVGEGRDKFGHSFSVDTGTSSGEIGGHSKIVNAVDIRHQRPFRAATASDDATIIFHSGVPYKYEKTIRTHTRFVQDVRFSPNGDLFASVGSDSKAFIYDGKTGDTIAELPDPHKGSITAASWSPDSKSLLTSSFDCTVKLWDVEARKATNTWNLGSGVPYQQVGNTWAGTSSDEGIVSLSMNGDLNVFDRRVGDKPVKSLYGAQKAITAAASSSGTFFAGSYDGRITSFSASGEAAPLADHAGHDGQVVAMAAAGESGSVFSAGFDDRVRQVDPSSRSLTSQAVPITSQPKGIDAYAGGATVVFLVTGNDIQALEAGNIIFTLPVNFGPTAVAVTPSGNLVAVGAGDNKVYLYDWNGKELKQTAKLEDGRAAITSLGFAPNGVNLAVGDSAGKIAVYNVTEKKLVTSRWTFHTARINSLAWTTDSKHCVSGSLDTHIYVWSLEKPLKKIAIMNAVAGGVSVVGWKDGKTVIGAGADGCVRTWGITFHA